MTEIYGQIFDIYQKYHIRNFPIDIFSLAIRMGFNLHRFSSVRPETLRKILKISDSACLLDRTIYFNDKQPIERVRFSICHEIAHDLLETEDEDLADLFASELLAPSPIIRTRGYKTADEVAESFELSISAANRVLYRGKRWAGFRLPSSDPAWQIVRWFDGEKRNPEPQTVPEKKQSKRLPPLISKEEKEKWSPEQQKAIASIRRKRRKIAKAMDGVEGTSNMVIEFGLLEHELEYRRLGGGL